MCFMDSRPWMHTSGILPISRHEKMKVDDFYKSTVTTNRDSPNVQQKKEIIQVLKLHLIKLC